MNKSIVLSTVFSSIGGALIGGVITYLVVKKHYEKYAQEEIAEVRRHYALIRKDENTVSILGDLPTNLLSFDNSQEESDEIEPDGTPEQYARVKQLISEHGYAAAEEVTTSVFDKSVPESEVGPELDGPNGAPIDDTDEPEVEDPMANYVRYSGKPYIISQEEMFNEETEWEKPTLSYYVDDDTLVDERDKLIDDVERYVGRRHLDMFGILSEDENIVYVRNPQMSVDFEIIKEPGKYSVRVLGQPDYEEAAEKQRIRRMRDSD